MAPNLCHFYVPEKLRSPTSPLGDRWFRVVAVEKWVRVPPNLTRVRGGGESILIFSILSLFWGVQVSKKIKCPSTDFGCGPGAGPFFFIFDPRGVEPFFFPVVIPKLPNTSYKERRRKHARDGNIVLSWMRCFGGFRSSRRYHPNQKNEIYNFRVVPDLQISK